MAQLLVLNPMTRAGVSSEEMFFGDYTELQYYNHMGGEKAKNSSKGVRLVMGSIC